MEKNNNNNFEKIIEEKIYSTRGYKVILDIDVAELFEIDVDDLRKTVKRNLKRFPEDFMFQLNPQEARELNSDKIRKRNVLPYAFTEPGLMTLTGILKTPKAIEMSIQIVKIFTMLRETPMTFEDIKLKLEAMEKKYDALFELVFKTLESYYKKQFGPDNL